jgi:DNA helicase-2/ATP-dependent DNA helicase PcrA
MAEVEAGNDGAAAGEGLVTISTIHGAKGREFDHVLLPSWADGFFPGKCSREDEEECRRLAFVAVTRARKSVIIGVPHSQRPFIDRPAVDMEPSRFIAELGIVGGEFHVEQSDEPEELCERQAREDRRLPEN